MGYEAIEIQGVEYKVGDKFKHKTGRSEDVTFEIFKFLLGNTYNIKEFCLETIRISTFLLRNTQCLFFPHPLFVILIITTISCLLSYLC